MTETELIALITAAGTAIGAGLRWALRLWAQIRREEMDAARIAGAQVSADHVRMVEALIGQARSMAELGGRIDALGTKLDTLVDWHWRERTPVEGYPVAVDDEHPSERRRAVAGSSRGYRAPRPGTHHDE